MLFWVDVDNAPHVLVMRPIIVWLLTQGHEVEVTARNYGQTVPLLELFRIPYTLVGKHAGRHIYRKALSFITRSFSLLIFARRKGFAAIICHGTRGVYVPARLLRIPLVVMTDYEHAVMPSFMRDWPRILLVPEVIPDEALAGGLRGHCELVKYPGLKEELYVYDLVPDPAPLREMGIDLERPLVLIRPPASMAHYHVEEGDKLFLEVLEHFCSRPGVQVVLLPRTEQQSTQLRCYLKDRVCQNIQIPDHVDYGPNLIYHSDLVISGGGTMNREAACMGVPVLSIFRGPLGSVDKQLIRDGRLRLLRHVHDLENLPIEKLPKWELKSKRGVRESLVRFIGNVLLSVTTQKAPSTAGAE